MDQQKIGLFLKELRTEKALTQQQLAEKLNVSARTVSRWENGNNMPDLSIIVELSDFYEIDIRELLNGERKSEFLNEDIKETLEIVAEYTTAEKKKLTKELYSYSIGVIVCFALIFIINVLHLSRLSIVLDNYANTFVVLGLVYSIFSIIKIRQLTGEMNKKSFYKFILVFLIVLGVLFCCSIFFLLLSIGIFNV